MDPKYRYLGIGVGIGAILSVVVGFVLVDRSPVPEHTVAPAAAFSSAAPIPVQGPREASVRPTLSQIMALQSHVQRQSSVYRLASMADEAALVDLLEQTQVDVLPGDADWIVPVLYARYAEIDGAAALAHLRDRSYGFGVDQSVLTSLFLAWIRVDEDAALETLAGLGPQEKLQVGASILRLDSYLSESQKRALGERLGVGRYMSQFNAASRLRLSDDPHAQLDELLASSDYRVRQYSLITLMAQWAKKDPEAAMAATGRVAGLNIRRQLQQQVMQQWAQVDAAGALQWAVAQPQSAQRNEYWHVALQSMATQDPRGAMELVSQLEPEQRDAAVGTVLTMWGMVEPRGAAQWLERLEDPALRAQVVGQIAQGYARQYPGEALQWVDALPPAERSRAAHGLVNSLVEVAPSSAVSVLGMIDDPQQRASAAHNLALNWARHEPRAAAEWIAENIAAERRPQVLSSVVLQWAQYDTEAAVRYADTLEATLERETAVVAVLPYLQSDPARADAYYESLTRPETRQAAAQMLYGYWRHTDPARAKTYRLAAGIEEGADDTATMMGVGGRARAIELMRNPSIQLSR